MSEEAEISGRNGVAVKHKSVTASDSGYRTYEVYQRERVGQSTEKIKPAQLNSREYRVNPYPLLGILRENYPCYRDWLNNCFWVTPYNDVTSLLADDANFETRSKCWFLGITDNSEVSSGRNLNDEIIVQQAIAEHFDANAKPIAQSFIEKLDPKNADLATQFCAPFAAELLLGAFGVLPADMPQVTRWYWQMQRGVGWSPQLQSEGVNAFAQLVQFFAPILQSPIEGTVVATLLSLDEKVTPADVVTTLLEHDHETLHGALANMWYLLLSHPQEFEKIDGQKRLMKLAYLEAVRHSTPVISARRFARHEVERFGRLIPAGALVVCSAAAANRDPQVFSNPDQFIVDRKDLCQREARGQYRADGLATGITYGLGKPSIHPAVPEDRPRSKYALVRDTAVDASMTLVEMISQPTLKQDLGLCSLTQGEMHTCWSLPISFNPK